MPTPVAKLKALLKFAKSVDDGALKDIEQIDDITDDNERIPDAREVGTSRDLISARGGAAAQEVARNSDLAPQTGVTEQYIRFAARLAKSETAIKSVATSVKAIVDLLKKAGDEAEKEEREAAEKAKQEAAEATRKAEEGQREREKMGKENTAPSDKEAAEKALNKAARLVSLAITKAEDVEDAENIEEELGKAEKALSAFKVAVEKAEEDAEDDDGEKRAEKGRQKFRDLRKALKDARTAYETRKAAVASAATPAAKSTETPTVTPDVAKALDTLAVTLGMQTMTIQDFMGRLSAGGRQSTVPPTFAKSAAATAPESLDITIGQAFESGLLDTAGLMKARSIQNHLVAAKAGRIDLGVVEAEVEQAPDAVKHLFLNHQPTQAAA